MKLNESLERLELIDQLLDLEGIDLDVNVTNLVKPLDLLDSCEAIIRKSGKPLHIKELHSALVEIGANIPGKGNMANVISRIQRSNGRVIRTGKGMYGLPEFGLPEIKPTKKLRKPN